MRQQLFVRDGDPTDRRRCTLEFTHALTARISWMAFVHRSTKARQSESYLRRLYFLAAFEDQIEVLARVDVCEDVAQAELRFAKKSNIMSAIRRQRIVAKRTDRRAYTDALVTFHA